MTAWMTGPEFLALRKECDVTFEQLADWTGVAYKVAREWGHSRPAPLYVINLLVLYRYAPSVYKAQMRTLKT